MTDESTPKAGSPALRTEIRSILKDEGTAEDLASQLDFSGLAHWDEYEAWHPSKPLKPMVRLHFLRCLYGWSHAEAARYTENTDSRTTLGFSDSLSRSTVSRAWNNRFNDDLRFTLQRHAMAATQVAEEIGHPLAIEISKPETDGTSKSTESRLVRKCLEEIPPTVLRVVQPNIDFIPNRAKNSQYTPSQFLEIESRIGVLNGAIEDGCKQYRISNGGNGPGGDIFRHYLKQTPLDELLERFRRANQAIIQAASHRLNFSRGVTVAIDITPVPYYGDRRDEHIIEAAPEKSYPYKQEFAAVCVVEDDARMMLTFQRRKEGESAYQVVDKLLNTASELVNIKRVYADRGFASAGVIQNLESRNLIYAIPAPRNKRLRRTIQKMEHDVQVGKYVIYGETMDGSTRDRVETKLALVPAKKQRSQSEQKVVPFYTNENISDESKIDRESAKRRLDRYRYRWGIETAFKSLKQFLPVTASNNDSIRVFHFGFAVVLYNLWRLIDYVVKKELRGEIDYGEPPLVTLGQFREALRSFSLFM